MKCISWWSIIKRLYIPMGWPLLGAACLVGVAMLGVLGTLSIAGWFICACFVAGISAHPLLFNYLLPSSGVRFFAFIKVVSQYLARLNGHHVGLDWIRQWRLKSFDQFAKASRLNSAQSLQSATQDIDQLGFALIEKIMPTLAFIGISVIYAFMLGMMTGFLGLCLFVGVLVALLLILMARQPKTKASHQLWFNHITDFKMALIDTLRHMVPLMIDQRWRGRTQYLSQAYRHSLSMQYRIKQGQNLCQALLGIGEIIMIGWWLGHGVIDFASYSLGLAGLGLGIMATLAYFELARSFWMRGSTFTLSQLSAQRVLTKPAFNPYVNQQIGTTSTELVRIKQVTLHYKEPSISVFEDFSMDIQRGDKVLIHGPSGCGKSSLLKMIQGQLPPTCGQIWCPKQSTVLLEQHPYFFDASLMENLSMGLDVDREQIAHLMQVLELTQDLSQPVGVGGSLLSQGQKRRLALIRGLIHPHELLLLDEPVAHLDPQLAGQVWQLIRAHPKTVCVASHQRPSDWAFDQAIDLTLK